jgi:gliding motility-associatede transport system auxiliary component
MAAEPPAPHPWSPVDRWRIGANVFVSSLALLAVVVMVNYLSARHLRKRFHWGQSTVGELSPMTVRLLRSLTNNVKVVVFFNHDNPLYDPIVGLLREYALLNPRIRVQYIDYETNPGAAALFKQRYQQPFKEDHDLVLFDCNGKTQVVYDTELSSYDFSNLLSGKSREVKRTAFKGELLFTSAIVSVIDPTRPQACFLEGHDEFNPDKTSDRLGYSKFAAVLRERDFKVSRLSLSGTNEVPPDALLIIAGPKYRLEDAQLDKIERFLNNGGRLLVLLLQGDDAGLDTLLHDWGVVSDAHTLVYDNRSNPYVMETTSFSDHPTVAPLANVGLLLVAPRPVEKASPATADADAPAVKEIIFSNTNGVAAGFHGSKLSGQPIRQGSIPLAAAVEKGGIQGVRADRGATRLVVVGDAQFLDNQLIEWKANRDFAALAANWLLDRSQLLGGIGPQPIKEYRVDLTPAQLTHVHWLLLGGLPGAVMLLGLGVWWVRRR